MSMFYDKTDEDVLLQQLSTYLKTLENNDPIILKKRALVTWSSWLLAAMVVLLLITAFIPKTIA
jgi:hypothetical protein